MSQMPPPPPSQPEPAPMPSAAGGNKNLYSILAWALLPPIGSLIFLFVGKDDPDVKYNAAQAFIVHGAAFVVWLILRILAGIGGGTSGIGLFFGFVLLFWLLVWFIIWLVGLIVALQAGGRRISFPVLGPVAQPYIPMVEGWAK